MACQSVKLAQNPFYLCNICNRKSFEFLNNCGPCNNFEGFVLNRNCLDKLCNDNPTKTREEIINEIKSFNDFDGGGEF